jgi:hypothetical protein
MKSPTVAIIGTLFCAIATAYGDDPRNQVAVVDDPAEDYLVICGREFDREGGGYSICKIDLNEDGREDRMFANTATSGTGGEAATIYLAREDGRFTRIGTILHQALSTEKTRTGGQLLHCSSNGGGGHSSISTYLLSHEGLKEVMGVSGEWKDAKFARLFETVFAAPLKPEYRLVPARPKSNAEQAGAGQPATRSVDKPEGSDKPQPEAEGRSR